MPRTEYAAEPGLEYYLAGCEAVVFDANSCLKNFTAPKNVTTVATTRIHPTIMISLFMRPFFAPTSLSVLNEQACLGYLIEIIAD